MAYKILYVEDLQPGSILHELKAFGFEADHCNPTTLEHLIAQVKNYDLLLLDFRLTANANNIFDAPTIAQTIRTTGSKSHLDIPIVLISSESKITDYYKDFSSKDLFDYSVSKEIFLNNIDKYCKRFTKAIEAYKKVKDVNRNVPICLGISEEQAKELDYRIIEHLNNDYLLNDTFAFSNYIFNQIIRSVGVLIGEDILAARLGVDKSSEDWGKLKEMLNIYKYNGIYSEAYDRWWSVGVEEWGRQVIAESGLRRINAQQRVLKIIEFTKLKNLFPQKKTDQASSSNYWTICKHFKIGLDSIDGLELDQRDLKPWQEKEYISIQAGLESSNLLRFVKPFDREKLKAISQRLS